MQTREKSSSLLNRAWIPLTASFVLDLYSKWPDLGDGLNRQSDIPPLEAENRARRCLDFLYYSLREPVYSGLTKGVLTSIEGKMDKLKVLSPIVGTMNSKNIESSFIFLFRNDQGLPAPVGNGLLLHFSFLTMFI